MLLVITGPSNFIMQFMQMRLKELLIIIAIDIEKLQINTLELC